MCDWRKRERAKEEEYRARREGEFLSRFLGVMAGRIHSSRLAISRTSGCTGSSANSLHLEKSIGRLCIPSARSSFLARGSLSPRREGGDEKSPRENRFSSTSGTPNGDAGFSVTALSAPSIPTSRRRRHRVSAPRPGAVLHFLLVRDCSRRPGCAACLLFLFSLLLLLPPSPLSLSHTLLAEKMGAVAKLRVKLRGGENISSS